MKIQKIKDKYYKQYPVTNEQVQLFRAVLDRLNQGVYFMLSSDIRAYRLRTEPNTIALVKKDGKYYHVIGWVEFYGLGYTIKSQKKKWLRWIEENIDDILLEIIIR